MIPWNLCISSIIWFCAHVIVFLTKERHFSYVKFSRLVVFSLCALLKSSVYAPHTTEARNGAEGARQQMERDGHR